MSTSVQDFKPQSDGSFTTKQIIQLIEDVRDEPPWRENAAVEESFYEGNQLTQDTLEKMRQNGIPPVSSNLTQPVIDAMAGFEVITRTDPIVLPENDQSQEGAKAYNQLLKKATRMARFNEACSEAFQSASKVGIGWIEITRNSDPFKDPYYTGSPPWREMWWDWRARNWDLSDARYFLRRKWFDRDILATILPWAKDTIMRATSGWPSGFLGDWDTADTHGSARMGRSIDYPTTYGSLEVQEWIDPEFRRIALFEILYRVPTMAVVMEFPSGQKLEFDKKNRFHIAAVAGEQVELVSGPTTRLRQALYLGYDRLIDRPLNAMEPHYIPVIARREGGDGSPYGYIRSMKSPNEAYNQRYARVLHDLSGRRVIASEDAVVDHEATRRDINKNNAYILLKSGNLENERFEIVTNVDMTQISMALMENARRDIHAASGIPQEFVGASAGGSQSGVAIDSLVDQGRQVLGPFLRNYQEARRRSAQRLLDMVVEDMHGKEDVEVRLDPSMAEGSKTVFLNRRSDDGGMDNRTVWLRTHVALSETPATPTYRAQQFTMFAETLKSLPPEIQVALSDLLVSMSETPHKDEIIERIRGLTGFGPEPEDPQKREELRQQQAKEQQIADKQQVIEMLAAEGQARKLVAEAKFLESRAAKLEGVDTEHTQAKTIAELTKIQQSDDVDERAEVELQRKLTETGGNLAIAAQKSRIDMAKVRAAGERTRKR